MRLIVVLFLFFIASCDGSTREDVYASHAAAKSAGEVRDDGPIPTFLPSSITNIRARYNIESNELWLSFDWNGTDLGEVEARCTPAALLKDQFPTRVPTKWPRDLERGSSHTLSGAVFMVCGEGYLALQATSRRGFYWMNVS
jgi:hypothetical protein